MAPSARRPGLGGTGCANASHGFTESTLRQRCYTSCIADGACADTPTSFRLPVSSSSCPEAHTVSRPMWAGLCGFTWGGAMRVPSVMMSAASTAGLRTTVIRGLTELSLRASKRNSPGADRRLVESGPRLKAEPREELVKPEVVHSARDRGGDAVQDQGLQPGANQQFFSPKPVRSSCPR